MHDRKNSRADRRLLRLDASGTNNFGVTLEVFLDHLSELDASAAIGVRTGTHQESRALRDLHRFREVSQRAVRRLCDNRVPRNWGKSIFYESN
jgi:hypothetical protein